MASIEGVKPRLKEHNIPSKAEERREHRRDQIGEPVRPAVPDDAAHIYKNDPMWKPGTPRAIVMQHNFGGKVPDMRPADKDNDVVSGEKHSWTVDDARANPFKRLSGGS